MGMNSEMQDRLNQQLQFIAEIDKVKKIIRQTLLLDKSKQENDAEHSWHMAMAMFILLEHSNHKNLDLVKAVKMVLIHDIVEIDAGDAYAYDAKANEGKFEREVKAADRIFGLLPKDQAEEYKKLWLEFEEGESPEAQFVGAIDKFMPMYHNYLTEGEQWKKHEVTTSMVIKRNNVMQQGSEVLWNSIHSMLMDAEKKGYLKSE